MRTFLPQLINPVLLMRAFAETQALQCAIGAFALQVVDDLSGGEGFELAEAFVEVWSFCNKVQMVFQDDIALQL